MADSAIAETGTRAAAGAAARHAVRRAALRALDAIACSPWRGTGLRSSATCMAASTVATLARPHRLLADPPRTVRAARVLAGRDRRAGDRVARAPDRVAGLALVGEHGACGVPARIAQRSRGVPPRCAGALSARSLCRRDAVEPSYAGTREPLGGRNRLRAMLADHGDGADCRRRQPTILQRTRGVARDSRPRLAARSTMPALVLAGRGWRGTRPSIQQRACPSGLPDARAGAGAWARAISCRSKRLRRLCRMRSRSLAGGRR